MTTPPDDTNPRNSGQESPAPEQADHFPLDPTDPLKVGDFWLDSRLSATDAGMAFSAHEDGSDPVMLLLLNQGAAADPAARARFAGEVNAMHIDTVVARGGEGQDEGRMAVRYRDESDDPEASDHTPLAPWVALAFDGWATAVAEADRVLHAVDLELTPQLGKPAGPNYQLHWAGATATGRTRLWPLPWPGRGDRAGWITILVSWLLMMLIAAVAVLLAILVFQNQPQVDPPPPIPSDGSGSGSGSPESPQSASQSGSQSGSPSGPPESQPGVPSRTDTPSMNVPSGDESGVGDPTPNRKL